VGHAKARRTVRQLHKRTLISDAFAVCLPTAQLRRKKAARRAPDTSTNYWKNGWVSQPGAGTDHGDMAFTLT